MLRVIFGLTGLLLTLATASIGAGRAWGANSVMAYVEQYGESNQARLLDVNRNFDMWIQNRVECQLEWLPGQPTLLMTTTPLSDFHQVMLLNVTNGDAQTLTVSDNHNDAPSLAPDGRSFIYAANQQRDNTLYRASLNQPHLEHQPIATVPMWVRQTHWSPDGRYIAVNGVRNNRYPTLALIDTQTGTVETFEGPQEHERGNWSAKAVQAARTRYESDTPAADLYTHDTTDDSERHLVTVGSEIKLPAWSPDGAQIAVVQADEHQEIALYDMAAGEMQPLTTHNFVDITMLAWSPDGRHIAFAAREDDPSASFNRLTPYNLYVVNRAGDVRQVRRGWGAYVNNFSRFCAIAWMP